MTIKICLTMIVKDEAKIIERCLASVLDYIDYWIICDTGSTDNTKKLIKEYFKTRPNKKGEYIEGELHQVPWRDFGYNRTRAVQLSKNKADYLLLMDADFIFKIKDPFFKSESYDKQVYRISYEGDTVDYQQLLFIKADADWAYQGRTHEHLVLPESQGGRNVTCGEIKAFTIEHPGDGGNKKTKHQRDRDLLLLDLKDIPDNSRTVFYLAQSYFALGDWKNAAKYYRMRVEMGGKYMEEIYLSAVYATHAERNLDKNNENFTETLENFLKAHYLRPQRLEALHAATKYCHEIGKYYLGLAIGSMGINTPYPEKDKLFVNKMIHTYGLLSETLQCANMVNNWDSCHQISSQLLESDVRNSFNQKYINNLEKIQRLSQSNLSLPQNEEENTDKKKDKKRAPISISLCNFQREIIQNNQRKYKNPLKDHPKILIIGNFMSYNMNRGISNNRIKFLHHLSSRDDNNIIIQGLNSDYFLKRELSLETLLSELGYIPDLIIYYLMGTTDHYLGNPFKDFQEVSITNRIKKLIWIEDIQYLKVYRGFIALNGFNSVLLSSHNTKTLNEYKKTFPELEIRSVEQYIDNEIFHDYKEEKTYDLLFYGCPAPTLYPFRYRMYKICHKLKKEGKYNVRIIEHPGYSNDKTSKEEGNIVNEDLSRELNKSYLTVCTKSTYDLLLKKYMEAGLSKSVILGDIPSDYQNLRDDIYMVEVTQEMSDAEIIRKIEASLEQKSILENRAHANYDYFKNHFTYEVGYEKFYQTVSEMNNLRVPINSTPIAPKQTQQTQQPQTQTPLTIKTDETTSFVLPDSLNIKRDVLKNELQHMYYRDHTGDPNNPQFIKDKTVETRPLEEQDLIQYDRNTVFYDVFFDTENKNIIALGPTMVNLSEYLSTTTGYFADNPNFDNKHLVQNNEIQVEQSKLNIKIIFKNPLKNFPNFDKNDPNSTLYLRLVFPKLQNLAFQAEIHPNLRRKVHLSMTTIQKNNKPEWIYDWLEYYYHQGLDRAIIYDNGSDVETLEKYVNGINNLTENRLKGLEVIVVSWNFKYGPYRSTYNQFCQTAQILHAMQKYGQTSWMINCDVDEYLLHGNHKITLKNYLETKIPSNINVIYADSYNMANIPDEELTENASARVTDYNQLSLETFKYRFKTKRGFNFKYIVRPETVIFCGPHDVISRNDPEKKKVDAVTATDSPIFFYHYPGLTINWKPFEERERKVLFNPDIFTPDLTTTRLLNARSDREFENIKLYVPNSLEIPKHYKQRRKLYKNTTDIEGQTITESSKEYEQEYDKWTIFYDVFLGVDNKELIALAPNFVNLEQFLINFDCYYVTSNNQNEQIKLNTLRIEKTDVRLKFVLDPEPILSSQPNNDRPIKLKFVFPGLKNMEWNVQLYLNDRQRQKGEFLSMTTIQKDNQIQWIHDWLDFYYYQGVREVILYDNKSEDRRELLEFLEHDEISDRIKITVVLWDFPYGPGKSCPNQYCQPGSLTHAILKYGDSEWLLNVDIDEYMIPCENSHNNSHNLIEYIKAHEKEYTEREISFVRVDSYTVYNISYNDPKNDRDHKTDRSSSLKYDRDHKTDRSVLSVLSVLSFRYRAKKLTGDNHKYFLRPWAAMFAKAHEARMHWGEKIDADDLVFYHYVGLTTNWKPHQNRTKRVAYDPKSTIYIEDTKVATFLETHKQNKPIPSTPLHKKFHKNHHTIIHKNKKNIHEIISKNNKIFLFWERYKDKERAPYLDMCLETVYRHLGKKDKDGNDIEVILLTPENLQKHLDISQLHPKWNQIKIPPQKSDYLRVMAIYQHGGFWLDFDTIVMKSFKPWVDILNSGEYDLVFGDFQVFGAPARCLFLEKAIEKIHEMLDNSEDLNFNFAALGGEVTGKIMEEMEKVGDLKVYRPPTNQLNCATKIGWETDNLEKGYFSKQNFEDYYSEDQVVVRLHNSMYKHEYVNWTKEQLLEDPTAREFLFTKFYQKSMGIELKLSRQLQPARTPKNKYVIITADSKRKYSRHVPIVAYLWKYLIGYTPIIYFIEGDQSGYIEDFVFEKTKEVGCIIAKVPENYAGFKQTGNLAQNIRIFVAQIQQNLDPDDYIMITDADMYPLSKDYFNNEIDWTKDFHILNAKGMSPTETEYPMCYLGGYANTWLEILGTERLQNSANLMDQPYITKLIKKWSGFPEKTQRKHRPLDPRIKEKFHMKYTDRIDKGRDWRSYQKGDVDAHIFKSTRVEDWKKLEKLVAEIGMLSKWAKRYFETVYQVETATNLDGDKIFMYWEDKPKTTRPDYLNLCLETIKRHIANDYIEVIIVTPENVCEYIPNLHPRWKDLKVIAHKADYVRITTVYHHGGFWLDFDTVLMKSIKPWFNLLNDPNKYDLVFGGTCLFGAQKGCKYLEEYLTRLHRLFDQNPGMQFKWTQFYDEIGGPLKDKMIHMGTLKIYEIPPSQTQPNCVIPWHKDNQEEGWISDKLKFDDYYNPEQVALILHNKVYPEEIKKMNRKDFLNSGTLLAEFMKKSFYDYIQTPLSRSSGAEFDSFINKDVKIKIEIDWKETDPKKQLEIEMTVALPAYNNKDIIWLALESLRNQKELGEIGWELIIYEEFGYSKELITEKFLNKLQNCQRLIYVSLDKQILLVEKWIEIAKKASLTSKIYVMQAADDYSSAKRLKVHYEHFRDNNNNNTNRCLYSTQQKGLFYNCKTGQKIFYDGSLLQNSETKCHLFMAIRMQDILRIHPTNIDRYVDNYIFSNIAKINKIKMNKETVRYSTEIDHEDWKGSFATDGFNSISKNRQVFYDNPCHNFRSYDNDHVKLGYLSMTEYIPKNVIDFINKMKRHE